MIYHPQANCQVECFNKVFKDFLQVLQAMKENIKENLEEFLGVYRSIFHATTKLSPSELLHNRRMRMRLDVIGLPDFERDYAFERRKVEEYQAKMKAYRLQVRSKNTEVFCRRLCANWHTGITAKSGVRFGHSIHTEQQVGLSSFKTTDGATWSAEHLAPTSSTRTESATDRVAPPASPRLTRTSRIRRPPQRYSP